MRKNDRGVILLCEAADRLDKTVWCYTELRGLICGTAKGAQSGKNRFGGSLEPFNEVELVLYEKEGTGRPIIESAGRSFTEPAGLLPSSLPRITLPRAAHTSAPMRCNATSGVLPMAASMVG